MYVCVMDGYRQDWKRLTYVTLKDDDTCIFNSVAKVCYTHKKAWNNVSIKKWEQVKNANSMVCIYVNN